MKTIRHGWCLLLANSINPSFPEKTAGELLEMMTNLETLPDGLFSEDSAIHVSGLMTDRYTPGWGTLRAALLDYGKTFVPDRHLGKRLPAPNAQAIIDRSPEAIAAVRATVAGREAELAAEKVAAGEGKARPDMVGLPDVTLKGEALAELRAKRGLMFKKPAKAPPLPITRHAIMPRDVEPEPLEVVLPWNR